MTRLNQHNAFTLVKAGLESGAIKLRGPSEAADTAQATEDASIDATYLLALLEGLMRISPER